MDCRENMTCNGILLTVFHFTLGGKASAIPCDEILLTVFAHLVLVYVNWFPFYNNQIRNFYHRMGFLQVDIPVLESHFGGAHGSITHRLHSRRNKTQNDRNGRNLRIALGFQRQI